LLRADNPPYQEIADILELTVPAVKSLINRARETIRQRLEVYRKGKVLRNPAVLRRGEESA
jgi:DNA-directed RNA polymerase specialized sigma24 family protein